MQFVFIFWSFSLLFLFVFFVEFLFLSFLFVFILFFLVLLGVVIFLWRRIGFFFLCFVFLNLSCKQTYDSWRLGHVEPDDIVIADIGDQALGIFLHGPESTHKNGIGKTFTHTSIPIHTPKTKSKTLNSPNMTPSFSCPHPVQCGGGRRPGSLADAPHECPHVGGLLG